MKNSLLYRVFCKVIPELKLLKKDISWNDYLNNKGNSYISTKSKVYTPYNLQNVEIGDYSYIERNSFVSETNIGKYCSIGPNLFCGWGIHPTDGISSSPMFYSTRNQNGISLSNKDKIEERKKIVIGNDVFIGANVTILDGVTIGDGAIIGAGSVVSRDIPPYAIAVGSPVGILRYRFTEDIIDKLLKIKWWNFPDEKLKEVEKYFFNINEFINKHYAP